MLTTLLLPTGRRDFARLASQIVLSSNFSVKIPDFKSTFSTVYTSSKNEKLVTRTIDSCSQDGPVAPDAPPCQRVQFDYTK